MLKKRIGLKDIRAIPPGETIWDTVVAGFGARRQKGKDVSYFVKYRTGDGRQRWATIGRHGAPWTPDMARDKARQILGEVVSGADPSGDKIAKRRAMTVADLCNQYMEDCLAERVLTRHGVPKKPGTLAIDRGRIERHIKPLLGRMPMVAVTRRDVQKFRDDIAEGQTAATIRTKARGLARVTGGRTTATRTIGLLGGIFTYAMRMDLRPDNPVRGVQLFADKKRKRRLSNAEFAALGHGLKLAAEANMWPPAVAAARLIALTGWRSGEVLGLRRSEIDLERRTATLDDTKTGRSLRPLSRAACEVLRERLNDQPKGTDHVFPGQRGNGGMSPGFWRRIAKLSALPKDITKHVFRHTFSSIGNDLRCTEATIGAIVGHKGRTQTSQYIHSVDAVLLAEADRIADHIVGLMDVGMGQGAETECEPALYNVITP